MEAQSRRGRTSTATDPKLERKLQGMSANDRAALLEDLLRRHVPDEREYKDEQSKRAGVLAVLYAFPRASYSAISMLLYGDDSLENRLKVAGHAAQLGAARKLRNVGRGAWEPGPKHPSRVAGAKKRAPKG